MNGTTQPQGSFEQGGRILVLEPEEELATSILVALREAAPAAHVDMARNLEEAQFLVLNDRPDLFVLDMDAAPDLGQDFLYDLRTSHPNARAIVLTDVHLAAHRERAAGLGAVHFLEKPFPHDDFVVLAQALLSPSGESDSEKFQGTLSDLHLADIIQLKCMSGSSAALQFTGPQGEKARVYFESGQVRHATAPGKEGVAAFNEIVNWKGGQISEVAGAPQSPRTIDLDWQILLMDAVREIDETRDTKPTASAAGDSTGRKVLVVDDSLMLLSFVKEILSEANYQVTTAATAEEGLVSAKGDVPDLVLLDYVLPDMKGDEVSRYLSQTPATAKVRIVYMSGFGADLKPDQVNNANVIGSLNKPFTSDLLLKTVEKYMPEESSQPHSKAAETEQSSPAAAPAWAQPEAAAAPEEPRPAAFDAPWRVPQPEPEPEPNAFEPVGSNEPSESTPAEAAETAGIAASAGATTDAWWSAPLKSSEPSEPIEPSEAGPAESSEAAPAEAAETEGIAASAGATTDAWWSVPISQSPQPFRPEAIRPEAIRPEAPKEPAAVAFEPPAAFAPDAPGAPVTRSTIPFEAPAHSPAPFTPAEETPLPVNGAFFSGDTTFFSLNGALQAIGKEKLTGTLRAFWNKEPVELLAKNGEIVLVTTHDPQLYCPEAPITLVNVDAEKTEQARATQRETGEPVFLTLSREELILAEPAAQLVQHYGQKLFAQLWTATRVRFVFEQSDTLPDYCKDIPGEPDIDHWVLTTLRCIQFTELGQVPDLEAGCVPAYTRDGFHRVQQLRLTVAEAQFASQFNGVRSIAQIAKNLRLDFKFARLTLFRFLALEIVECWPPAAAPKPEKRGFFKAIGFGD